MSAFMDASIPQIYENNSVFQFSKVAFVNHLCRALDTVGMVGLTGLFPFDIFGNAEFPVTDGVYVFPFDYPDTQTFNLNQTLYRPCVVVVMYIGNTNATTNPTHANDFIVIDHAIRTDGTAVFDDIRTIPRERGLSNQGYGNGSTAVASQWIDSEGAYIGKSDWLPYVGSGDSDDVPLAVGHWFVYLGPGGLHVYVGSDNTRAAFGDILAWGGAFGGARIPGRALPQVEDVNLDRINPVIPLYHRESGTLSSIWNTTVSDEHFGLLRTRTHGIQHALKFTTFPVEGWLFNLENIEFPIFPFYGPDTKPSPRPISTGGGGHILGRVVHVLDNLEGDTSDLFGPTVPELDADDVRPLFQDVFTCPGFRFCDVSAPIGDFEDPNTLTNWRLVPTYNTGQLVALQSEGAVVVDTLATLNLMQVDDDYYDLTGANGWGNSFPTTVNIFITTNGGASGATVWDDTDAGDKQEFDNPVSAGVDNEEIVWEITADAADADDTLYRIQFDAFNREDPQRSGDAEGVAPLTLEYNFNGNWAVSVTIENAGTNTGFINSEGENSYNLSTYTGSVAVDTSTATRQLTLRWRSSAPNNTGAIGEVGNIHVLKFRYL